MAKNFFQEKIIKASSRRLQEIEQAVVSSGSSFKSLLKINNLIMFSLIFSFLGLIGIGIFFLSLPIKVPLFYSRPWGEEQLANKELLFLIPGLTLIFSLLNFLLTKTFLKKTNQFLLTMLCFFSFFLSFIGFFTLIKIILLML